MNTPDTFPITVHDELPEAAAAIVDAGLEAHNQAAAPLHEVRALSCFVHDAQGSVVGGAVGRRWGELAELQQLWVAPTHRGQGLGARLVRAFEARAREHGCRVFFLETFSFQAPRLYAALGYQVVLARGDYPHGIVKHLMRKVDD